MPGLSAGDVSALTATLQTGSARAQNDVKADKNDKSEFSFADVMNDAKVEVAQNSNKRQNMMQDNNLQADRNKAQPKAESGQTKTEKTDDNQADKDKGQLKTDKPEEKSVTNETGTESKDKSELTEAVKEEAAKAGDELVEDAARELGVSQDEILLAMANLGIPPQDLLNPENLTRLIVEVSGDEDLSVVLTDEDLYTNLKALIERSVEVKRDLAEQLGISPEELEKELQKFTGYKPEGNEDPAFSGEITKLLGSEEKISGETASPLIQAKDSKETDDGPKVTVKDLRTDAFEDKVDPKLASQTFDNNKDADSGQKRSFTDEGSKKNGFEELIQTTSLINENRGAGEVVANERPVYTDQSQQTEIFRQIVDRLNVTTTDELSKVEMQLHPASLGTVKVMVQQAQDGTVTARFTAQTDAVRNALSSQIVQLQQKLDEQGIKVNAVEVAVDTHAFEQNLEQGQKENNSSENNARQSKTRRINLGDLDLNMEDAGELDETTRIAAEMMAANGNQVDYTA
ncbi:flagellar hook-length control protein FliK [Butyrivibrio sp. MC2013]|uniref:flagellar hook-length control protein FliK n=1 Tax=Butyrivibrio sp. MC2013 TaxID=1280686 RepID=UPI000406C849|nr:flagellar hook-length control protein FliK [Butyrivibrio sp. MC2013]